MGDSLRNKWAERLVGEKDNGEDCGERKIRDGFRFGIECGK